MALRDIFRDVAVSYLLGNKDDNSGAIKSRASRAAICAYHMHYPNSIFSLKSTREAIDKSSIAIQEKESLLGRLDTAKERWREIVKETLPKIADSLSKSSEEVEPEEFDDLDDDLPSGTNEGFSLELAKYATFSKIEYRKWRAKPSVCNLKASQQAQKFWEDHNQLFPQMSRIAKVVS